MQIRGCMNWISFGRLRATSMLANVMRCGIVCVAVSVDLQIYLCSIKILLIAKLRAASMWANVMRVCSYSCNMHALICMRVFFGMY